MSGIIALLGKAIPVILAVVAVIVILTMGYVKAPPDTAFIISGFRKPRTLIGRAGIRIPFLERLDKLSLKMISVDVKTTDFVPNNEYINVKVDATVKIRISQESEAMALAAKFFLNEQEDVIIQRVQDSGSRFMLWHSADSEYYGPDGGFDLDWVLNQDDEFEVISNIHDNLEMVGED